MELVAKRECLEAALRDLGSVMVAYSGGTDSAYLAFVAHRVLGDDMLAVIADSASLPRAELARALAFAEHHSIPIQILQTAELDNPDYQRNDSRRCFHCKDELFRKMEAEQRERGFAYLAYGMNLDDRGDYRPGQQAASEHNVVAPLVTAQLTKRDIRGLAREAGLELWDKPASACLSSRLEYGRAVTRETLSQIERAEDALHEMGFQRVRVRHHGELARIEIDRADLPNALHLEIFNQIVAVLRPLGFVYVTMDMQGYRSGSMNDVLPLSSIAPASTKDQSA